MSTTRRVCVLDVESALSTEALAFLPLDDEATIRRRALQEIAAVSLLEFTATDDGLVDLRLDSGLSRVIGEAGVLRMIDARLDELEDGDQLVTHNGVAHDMPLVLHRALRHWMFDARAIARWSVAPRDSHVDTLLRFGRRGDRAGPALVDLCAGLGFSAMPPAASLSRAADPLIRKGQVDVVATGLAFLHLMAMDRGSAGWLARCWRDVGRFLLAPDVRAAHLMPLARRGIQIGDALVD